jgi:hypothetical protein
MTKKECFEGIIWLALSLFLGVKAVLLDLGTLSSPGPGFMPFLVALFLFTLSLILMFQMVRSQKERRAQKLDLTWSAFSIAFSIGIYILFFKKVGFLLTTFMLMVFLFRMMGTKKWMWILSGSLFVTFLSYLLFGVALKLNLPAGIF